MTDELKKQALLFMFREFGKSIWWQPRDLTKEGNPEGNPPNLNLVQAESLFDELLSNNLVLQRLNENKEVCFILHQGKQSEWKNLIDPPGFFRRHWRTIAKGAVALILWLSAVVISAYLTKRIENRIDALESGRQRSQQPMTPGDRETLNLTH